MTEAQKILDLIESVDQEGHEALEYLSQHGELRLTRTPLGKYTLTLTTPFYTLMSYGKESLCGVLGALIRELKKVREDNTKE